MMATILSVTAFTALSITGTAGIFACGKTSLSARADTVSAKLLCPDTYAQYLALQSPSSVAIADGYLAITDGNTLYVYDESDNTYRAFTADTDKINNVCFDNAGNVYYLADLFVYKLPLTSLQAGTPSPEKLSDFGCSGFIIEGSSLYYTTGNKIGAYSLTDGTIKTLKAEADPIGSALSFFNDTLYYFCESSGQNVLHAIHPNEAGSDADTFVTAFPMQVRSVAIAGNQFCFTTRNGDFYAYNHTELRASEHLDLVTPLQKDTGDYVSLGGYNDKVYAIQTKTVRLYATEDTKFTDYEISASSSAPHRLSGATDVCLLEDKLLIADSGNGRISVYDTNEESFMTPIETDQTSPRLSAYGDTVLVSSSSAVLYSLSDKNYGKTLSTLTDEEIEGNIVGSVSLYDRYYLLTDENHCYVLSKESSSWQWTETEKQITRRATAFTADVYGSLYVAYDNAAIYRFTETEFLSTDGNGEKLLDGLLEADKLAIDYATNLYALSGGVLQKYIPATNGYIPAETFAPDYNLVKDDAPTLRSFAFGVEENETYLLYTGDYLVKTDELSLPTVMPVPVGNAATDLFAKETANFALTKISKGAILIEFDLATLPAAEYFPYVAFERCNEEVIAVRMGTENGYAILAVQGKNTNKHKTYLALESDCSDLALDEYKTVHEQALAGHLINDVSLFKFPCLTQQLIITDLPRGKRVTIIGEINNLGHGYYEIRYTTETGEQIGYIPKVFITLFDGSSPTPETTVIGNTDADKDSVWRMVYLILGLGAIGILIDVLLLRKEKPEDQDEQENE